MKNILTAITVVLLFCSFTSSAKKQPIFNGKDLTGWTIYGTEKWYVDKGEMICESGPDKKYGYLLTNKTYKNFDLTVEFLQVSNGNSGIFFRSSCVGTKISGWQCEVAPKGQNSAGIYESYGRGWLKEISDEKENILKPGKWNKMRLRVVGDHVQTWLNGKAMVDFNDEKIGKGNGSIALQIHDGGGIKVRWRKMMIEEL